MNYEAKSYENLLGTEGFSDDLLQNHFKLYNGYVNNTNLAIEKMSQLDAGTPEFAEIKRRFGWEFNGMRLHELYFGNLRKGGEPYDPGTDLAKLIEQNFSSKENWLKDLKNTASLRGIGWVITYYDPESKKLFNTWINEHDLGHLSGAKPLLVLDVFEHAFITDYGLNKADYIESFIKAIDWQEVNRRFSV